MPEPSAMPPTLPPPATRADLARVTLAVLFIGVLIVSALWVLRPFLGAIVWAAMVAISLWPVLLWLQRRLWGKRWLAVVAITLLLLLVFVVPLTMAVTTVIDHQERIVALVKSLSTMDLRQPPAWLVALPWVGDPLASAWARVADTGVSELAGHVAPYVDDAVRWVLAQLGNVGLLVVHVLLTVFIATVMFSAGEAAATKARRFGWRLGGERGLDAVTLAGQAVRGVAMGVVVTALVQSVLGGIGLAIAGVPAASALTAVMLMLCIAQLGPMLVLIPSTIWVFYTGDTAWGVFLLVWTLVVGTMDNFLRPFLIKRGADLPLLLILAGVIGGLFAFGLIGIFIGPVVLAVAYTLLDAWVDAGEPMPEN